MSDIAFNVPETMLNAAYLYKKCGKMDEILQKYDKNAQLNRFDDKDLLNILAASEKISETLRTFYKNNPEREKEVKRYARYRELSQQLKVRFDGHTLQVYTPYPVRRPVGESYALADYAVDAIRNYSPDKDWLWHAIQPPMAGVLLRLVPKITFNDKDADNIEVHAVFNRMYRMLGYSDHVANSPYFVSGEKVTAEPFTYGAVFIITELEYLTCVINTVMTTQPPFVFPEQSDNRVNKYSGS